MLIFSFFFLLFSINPARHFSCSVTRLRISSTRTRRWWSECMDTLRRRTSTDRGYSRAENGNECCTGPTRTRHTCQIWTKFTSRPARDRTRCAMPAQRAIRTLVNYVISDRLKTVVAVAAPAGPMLAAARATPDGKSNQIVRQSALITQTVSIFSVDACESKVEIVTPYWASNSAGKIRAIVNTQHFEQAIHQEVCSWVSLWLLKSFELWFVWRTSNC